MIKPGKNARMPFLLFSNAHRVSGRAYRRMAHDQIDKGNEKFAMRYCPFHSTAHIRRHAVAHACSYPSPGGR
ncbi:MAG: hypothetical protein LBB76_05230 [Azoarcus sp.]|jgi:hypothetical protein|nr:hypothetical protein [Azoarcus sp.]